MWEGVCEYSGYRPAGRVGCRESVDVCACVSCVRLCVRGVCGLLPGVCASTPVHVHVRACLWMSVSVSWPRVSECIGAWVHRRVCGCGDGGLAVEEGCCSAGLWSPGSLWAVWLCVLAARHASRAHAEQDRGRAGPTPKPSAGPLTGDWGMAWLCGELSVFVGCSVVLSRGHGCVGSARGEWAAGRCRG